MKQIKKRYKHLNTITMKLKYIMPMLTTVVLLVAGIVLFARCEKEKKVKSILCKGTTWLCDTNNYRIELYFSINENSFFSKVENHSSLELIFRDSTWNDFVSINDSVIQIVRQISSNDTLSNPNNILKMSYVSADIISVQFYGFSTLPTWQVNDYLFRIKSIFFMVIVIFLF